MSAHNWHLFIPDARRTTTPHHIRENYGWYLGNLSNSVPELKMSLDVPVVGVGRTASDRGESPDISTGGNFAESVFQFVYVTWLDEKELNIRFPCGSSLTLKSEKAPVSRAE